MVVGGRAGVGGLGVGILSVLTTVANLFTDYDRSRLMGSRVSTRGCPTTAVRLSSVALNGINAAATRLDFSMGNCAARVLRVTMICSRAPSFTDARIFRFGSSITNRAMGTLLGNLGVRAACCTATCTCVHNNSTITSAVDFAAGTRPVAGRVLGNGTCNGTTMNSTFNGTTCSFGFALTAARDSAM